MQAILKKTVITTSAALLAQLVLITYNLSRIALIIHKIASKVF